MSTFYELLQNSTGSQNLKESTEILSNIVTVLAVIAGGFIAWWKWIREKPQSRRGTLMHDVFVSQFDSDKYVVHVSLEICNKGTVPLEIDSGRTEIRRIYPLDKNFEDVLSKNIPLCENLTEIDWPVLEQRMYDGEKLEVKIDSGESERLYSDFLLPATLKVIAVKSEIKMKGDNTTIWPVTTFLRTSS